MRDRGTNETDRGCGQNWVVIGTDRAQAWPKYKVGALIEAAAKLQNVDKMAALHEAAGKLATGSESNGIGV